MEDKDNTNDIEWQQRYGETETPEVAGYLGYEDIKIVDSDIQIDTDINIRIYPRNLDKV